MSDLILYFEFSCDRHQRGQFAYPRDTRDSWLVAQALKPRRHYGEMQEDGTSPLIGTGPSARIVTPAERDSIVAEQKAAHARRVQEETHGPLTVSLLFLCDHDGHSEGDVIAAPPEQTRLLFAATGEYVLDGYVVGTGPVARAATENDKHLSKLARVEKILDERRRELDEDTE